MSNEWPKSHIVRPIGLSDPVLIYEHEVKRTELKEYRIQNFIKEGTVLFLHDGSRFFISGTWPPTP